MTGRRDRLRHDTRRGATVLLAVSCVLAVLSGTVVAGPLAVDSGSQDLSCMESSESASTTLEDIVTKTKASLPDVARSAMVGERILIDVDGDFYGVVINSNSEVTQVTSGKLSNPSLKVTMDCATVETITDSEDKEAAISRAIDNGDISWDGVSASDDIKAKFGGKAYQMYQISQESGDAGTAEKVSTGLTNGAVESYAWAPEKLADVLG